MERIYKKRTILSFVFAGLGLLGLLIMIFMNPFSFAYIVIGDGFYSIFEFIYFGGKPINTLLSLGLLILVITFFIRLVLFSLLGVMSVLKKDDAFKTIAKINKISNILMLILDVLAWLIVFSVAFVDLEILSVYSLPLQFLILALSIASLVASKKLYKTLNVANE